jgi:asparagine synthetase B (glutamine-hydrolysing)
MIYSYHPAYFKHFKRIASQYPNDPVSKKIEEFKFYHKSNNRLYWMGRFMTNSVPVDRTNKLNLLKMEDCPIPEIDHSFNKTYDEVCYSSASEYWKYHDDITVLWSGGLDSTCVAIAFLQTQTVGKRLSFVGSVESIEEYPKFYEDHKSLITIDTPSQFWNRFKVRSTDTRYVTGDIGDQIFGGCINEFGDKKEEDWQNFIDWKDTFRQSYMLSEELRREWTDKEKQKFLDKMEKFNCQAPFPIVTLFDFVWWLTFSTRVNGAGNNITVLTTEMTGIKNVFILLFIFNMNHLRIK